MPYVEWKEPDYNQAKTPIGRVMGYLALWQAYNDCESKCALISALWFLNFYPFDQLKNLLMDILGRRYFYDNYQHIYNRAGWKGDEINNQIIGWLDDLRKQAEAKVNEAKAWIETNLINPIKSQIDNNITPALNDAKNKLAKFETDLKNATTSLDALNKQIVDINTVIEDLKKRVTALEGKEKAPEEALKLKIPFITE